MDVFSGKMGINGSDENGTVFYISLKIENRAWWRKSKQNKRVSKNAR